MIIQLTHLIWSGDLPSLSGGVLQPWTGHHVWSGTADQTVFFLGVSVLLPVSPFMADTIGFSFLLTHLIQTVEHTTLCQFFHYRPFLLVLGTALPWVVPSSGLLFARPSLLWVFPSSRSYLCRAPLCWVCPSLGLPFLGSYLRQAPLRQVCLCRVFT